MQQDLQDAINASTKLGKAIATHFKDHNHTHGLMPLVSVVHDKYHRQPTPLTAEQEKAKEQHLILLHIMSALSHSVDFQKTPMEAHEGAVVLSNMLHCSDKQSNWIELLRAAPSIAAKIMEGVTLPEKEKAEVDAFLAALKAIEPELMDTEKAVRRINKKQIGADIHAYFKDHHEQLQNDIGLVLQEIERARRTPDVAEQINMVYARDILAEVHGEMLLLKASLNDLAETPSLMASHLLAEKIPVSRILKASDLDKNATFLAFDHGSQNRAALIKNAAFGTAGLWTLLNTSFSFIIEDKSGGVTIHDRDRTNPFTGAMEKAEIPDDAVNVVREEDGHVSYFRPQQTGVIAESKPHEMSYDGDLRTAITRIHDTLKAVAPELDVLHYGTGKSKGAA